MKIGVFICHCGSNIAGTVDCGKVAEIAKTYPDVAFSTDTMYTCSEPGQEEIVAAIKEHKLDGVVVASCTPRMHEPTFRRTVERAGLNKYMFEMANIREHVSWIGKDKEANTNKAAELVRIAVEKLRRDNPLFSKSFESTKRVLVIGGGVAGMEAARVAAAKGHEVVLFEKSAQLGGQLNIACVPPRKEEMRRAAQDLIHAVCNAGVHLCMGQTRTAEQLKDAGFEAVINAVGAHSAAPRIPGIDSVNVADAWKVLAGEQQVYGTVAVIGGGMVGCETAEYLAARGCKVSVIEMMDKIAAGESTTILPTLLENYKTYGVEQYPSHKVKEFRMDAVVCENKDGAEVTIPCDYIVLAMGARSNAFDAAALEAAGIPVYSIGDAAGKAADISNAIRTGYDTACQL